MPLPETEPLISMPKASTSVPTLPMEMLRPTAPTTRPGALEIEVREPATVVAMPEVASVVVIESTRMPPETLPPTVTVAPP